MKLSLQHVEPKPLEALATEVGRLLMAGKFSELAARFGYAVALGRDTSTAIQQDLDACLAHFGDGNLDPNAQPIIQVKYFKPNDQLHAVAECSLATASGHWLLAELVVCATGNDFHVTLEQISTAA